MTPLQQLVRKNIWSLAPYSSARDEYSGKEARVFLDANENPYNSPYNRYPDPLQRELKQQISRIKGVPEDMIFLGNGSDEAIDLPYRIFCEPGRDNVVAIEPTYGMYRVCADINDVEYRTVLLDDHYQFSAARLLAAIRLGMAFASPDIIALYNKVKYPYNVNQLTQKQAIEAIRDPFEVDKWVKLLLVERSRLMQAFALLPVCQQVFPSDANFFLARMTDAQRIYDYLVARGVIVRNRTRVQLCGNCLRITVGMKGENNELLAALRSYEGR